MYVCSFLSQLLCDLHISLRMATNGLGSTVARSRQPMGRSVLRPNMSTSRPKHSFTRPESGFEDFENPTERILLSTSLSTLFGVWTLRRFFWSDSQNPKGFRRGQRIDGRIGTNRNRSSRLVGRRIVVRVSSTTTILAFSSIPFSTASGTTQPTMHICFRNGGVHQWLPAPRVLRWAGRARVCPFGRNAPSGRFPPTFPTPVLPCSSRPLNSRQQRAHMVSFVGCVLSLDHTLYAFLFDCFFAGPCAFIWLLFSMNQTKENRIADIITKWKWFWKLKRCRHQTEYQIKFRLHHRVSYKRIIQNMITHGYVSIKFY